MKLALGHQSLDLFFSGFQIYLVSMVYQSGTFVLDYPATVPGSEENW